MVSFSCEGCGDVLTKKKLDSHRNQCRASFTCLDCMVNFEGFTYRAHTSCISEAQKYEGALYKGEKGKKGKQNNGSNTPKGNYANEAAVVPHKAYVEDVPEDVSQYEVHEDVEIVDSPVPEAPSPPAAVPDFEYEPADLNVFDFLVPSETPNASNLAIGAPESMNVIEETASHYNSSDYRDADDSDEEEPERRKSPVDEYLDAASEHGSPEPTANNALARVRFEDDRQSLAELVEYGNGPVETAAGSAFMTPAPKQPKEHKKEKKDRTHQKDGKKDKKRKRLHVETGDITRQRDETMTDAPPVLHSGLTGGLNRLLSRPFMFPPSPDYSGGDAEPPTVASPLKKTKHSKRKSEHVGTNIMSLIGSRRSSKTEERRKHKHRRTREPSRSGGSAKMLEFKPEGADAPNEGQMVLFSDDPAELLLSYVNKGPESDRGVSMNKALKRYHRDRSGSASGSASGRGKGDEEKELWRSLRMKRNDRGEIVLFMG